MSKYEKYKPHNIVQFCFHQTRKANNFLLCIACLICVKIHETKTARNFSVRNLSDSKGNLAIDEENFNTPFRGSRRHLKSIVFTPVFAPLANFPR